MLQTAQSASANSPAVCHIKGDSISLLTLITATNKTDALFNSNLTLSGNTDTAQELQAILSGLDIDWEEKLSHWVGDIAAHQLGNQTRSLLRWSQQTLNSLILDTEEYLHEESRSMPPRLELESFYQDIEHLTVETDRIAAKLQRIKDNMRPHTKIKQPTTEDTQS